MIHSFSAFRAPNRSSVNLIFEIELRMAAEELILCYRDLNLLHKRRMTITITKKYIMKKR
jgi:hypothetical protein|tara:strand:- start:491 stop:670 length:180 start_codon:yes stop_codon:yes gene_type:complete